MKRNWLLYLLIFSLALNVSAIGTVAYLHWHRPPEVIPSSGESPMPFRKLLKELDLDQQQRQTLRAMAPEHWRKVREMRDELAQQRQELFALIKQDSLPAWPAVQSKIREIGSLQLQLEEEKVHHLMDIQKNLRSDQRQVLITQLEKRLCCGEGRGRGRGMMRRMRNGRGPGPLGPMGPPDMR